MEGFYRRQVLANGTTLITAEISHLRSVSIGFWVMTGSRHETPSQNGISHFIEHLLFKGTKNRSPVEIAQLIDSIGGNVDASTSHEYTCFYARVLDEHLALTVELLSDIVLRPEFNPHELELERQVILEEIKTIEDIPDDYIHVLLSNAIWPDHPLGRSIIGAAQNVADFSESQIREFYQQHYQPDNIIISATGNIKHAELIKLLERCYTPAKGIAAKAAYQPAPRFSRQVLSHNKDLEQVHLCIASKGLAQNHRDRYRAELLNVILGGGNSSRLFQQIREQRGLAYSVYSYVNSYYDTGVEAIYAATDPKSAMEVIELILGQLTNLKQVKITAEELARSKNHLKGQLTLGLESTFNRMVALANHEIYFGSQFSLDEILAGIERVSMADINKMANELFDSNYLSLVMLGKLEGGAVSAEILRC